jgi:membrane fusion protein (multidrug efflux system)
METITNTTVGQGSKNSKGKKKPILYVLICIGVIILFFIVKYIAYSISHEDTDNAQIDGNVIPLRSKPGGYISVLRFVDNQMVHKGDTLAIIDTTDLNAQYLRAKALLESAMIAVEASQVGVESATYNTEAADQNKASAKARLLQAESDFKRVDEMYKKEAATPQQYDAAKAALDIAKAQYEALTAQKRTAASQINIQDLQIKAAKARVEEAKAQLVSAKYLLDNAYIVASFNGIVSKKTVEVGQLILPGTPIAMIIDLDNIWITANFKETQLGHMEIGQKAEISIDAYPDIEMEGRVESIAGATGPKFALLPADNATGNFVKVTQRVPVRIGITRISNSSRKQLVPGMNVIADVCIK